MTADQWIKEMVRRAVWGVAYHERLIEEAYDKLGAVKAFLARGDWPDINIEEMMRESKRQIEEDDEE